MLLVCKNTIYKYLGQIPSLDGAVRNKKNSRKKFSNKNQNGLLLRRVEK